MNCSLILEECIRDNRDSKLSTYIAFLDAKSTFDVVSHTSLMRKLFHIGIEGKTWKLINSLHRNARSVVKWDGMISDSFEIQQGVRQGGILSTYMYKVFINKLLDRLDVTMMGMRIGGINCVAPTCAGDVAIVSSNRSALQPWSILHQITALWSATYYSQPRVSSSVFLRAKTRLVMGFHMSGP